MTLGLLEGEGEEGVGVVDGGERMTEGCLVGNEGAVQGSKEFSLDFFCLRFVVVVVVGGKDGADVGPFLLVLLEDGGPQLSFGLVEGRGQTTHRENLRFTAAAGAALRAIGGVVLVLIGVVVVFVYAVLFFLKCFFDQGPKPRLNVRGRHTRLNVCRRH